MYLDVVVKHANEHGLRPEIVFAIIRKESGNGRLRYRCEPHYRYLWNCRNNKPWRLSKAEADRVKALPHFRPPKGLFISNDSEWWGQRASWGPMQIMGATARELGFKGDWPELCGEAGIQYGCIYLKRLKDRFIKSHGWKGVISAYNQGGPYKTKGVFNNQKYVDSVLRFAEKEKAM